MLLLAFQISDLALQDRHMLAQLAQCPGQTLRNNSLEPKSDQRASDRARKIAKRLHDKWGGATEDEYDFPPKPPHAKQIAHAYQPEMRRAEEVDRQPLPVTRGA